MANKEDLERFLDTHVFDPILKASPEKYSEQERDDLKYVQERTKTEKQRYHNYSSAEELVRMYKDDLHSENAKPVNQRLKRLGLPCLADVRGEFERKAA